MSKGSFLTIPILIPLLAKRLSPGFLRRFHQKSVGWGLGHKNWNMILMFNSAQTDLWNILARIPYLETDLQLLWPSYKTSWCGISAKHQITHHEVGGGVLWRLQEMAKLKRGSWSYRLKAKTFGEVGESLGAIAQVENPSWVGVSYPMLGLWIGMPWMCVPKADILWSLPWSLSY